MLKEPFPTVSYETGYMTEQMLRTLGASLDGSPLHAVSLDRRDRVNREVTEAALPVDRQPHPRFPVVRLYEAVAGADDVLRMRDAIHVVLVDLAPVGAVSQI